VVVVVVLLLQLLFHAAPVNAIGGGCGEERLNVMAE
jgi:hypothetical protein